MLSIEEATFGTVYSDWIEEAIAVETCREPNWSENVAVGGKKFVERVKEELGFRAIGRKVHEELEVGMNVLREPGGSYIVDSDIRNDLLSDGNWLVWKIFTE